LRLEPGLRFWTYAVFATLVTTGAIWLVADLLKDPEGEIWQMIAADMLMLHGITAMIALILIGAMIPLHIQRSWRAGKNRVSGAVMIGANAVLVATAWGLYYAGADLLRTFVTDVHIAAGLVLPALVIAHVMLGRRSRARRHVEQSAPAEVGAVFQAVTFSEDRGSR
jgi:small-conductance mechanosensitive channel